MRRFVCTLLSLLVVVICVAASSSSCPGDCNGNGICQSDGTCLCMYEYSWSDDCSKTRLEMMPEDTFHIYTIVWISTYSLMTFVTLFLFVYIHWTTPLVFQLTVQVSAYICLTLAFASRVAYYAVDPANLNHVMAEWADRLLYCIFYPLVFSAYTLVLYFWARSSFRASMGRGRLVQRLRVPFVIMNVVFYVVELTVTLVQYAMGPSTEPGKNKVFALYQIYLCVCLTLILVSFVYYASRIYTQFQQFAPSSSEGSRAFRKIALLTVGTAFCFLVGMLVPLLYFLVGKDRPGAFLVSDTIVQTAVIIACVLILVMIGKPRRPRAPPSTATLPTKGLNRSSSTASVYSSAIAAAIVREGSSLEYTPLVGDGGSSSPQKGSPMGYGARSKASLYSSSAL